MVLLLLQSIFPFALLPQSQPGGARASQPILTGRVQIRTNPQKGPLRTSCDLLGRHFPHDAAELPSFAGFGIQLQPFPSLELGLACLFLFQPFELIFPRLLGIGGALLRRRLKNVGPQPMLDDLRGASRSLDSVRTAPKSTKKPPTSW